MDFNATGAIGGTGMTAGDRLDLRAHGFGNVSTALAQASDLGNDVRFDFDAANSVTLLGVANILDLTDNILV